MHQLILQQLHKIQVQVTAVARPRNHEDPTNTAIHLDGGFFVFGRVFVVNRADGVWQEV